MQWLLMCRQGLVGVETTLPVNSTMGEKVTLDATVSMVNGTYTAAVSLALSIKERCNSRRGIT